MLNFQNILISATGYFLVNHLGLNHFQLHSFFVDCERIVKVKGRTRKANAKGLLLLVGVAGQVLIQKEKKVAQKTFKITSRTCEIANVLWAWQAMQAALCPRSPLALITRSLTLNNKWQLISQVKSKANRN